MDMKAFMSYTFTRPGAKNSLFSITRSQIILVIRNMQEKSSSPVVPVLQDSLVKGI